MTVKLTDLSCSSECSLHALNLNVLSRLPETFHLEPVIILAAGSTVQTESTLAKGRGSLEGLKSSSRILRLIANWLITLGATDTGF